MLRLARFRELTEHPYYKYEVELLVKGSSGNYLKIAAINCRDEAELQQATEWVDYVLQGEATDLQGE